MCLIAWNWQPHSAQPLLLVANRDEFFARPSLPLHRWDDGLILAGRDLQGGGTWLGVSADGRLAALTNFRDPKNNRANTPSRGQLVSDFLAGTGSAADYLAQLAGEAHRYNPFNLLLLDGEQLLGFESQGSRCLTLPPGVHGVSNARFDTPWPKLQRLKRGLAALPEADDETCLALLADETQAADDTLPATGIALERERLLSACFIRSPDYGTRASSVVRIDAQGLHFCERTFTATQQVGTRRLRNEKEPTTCDMLSAPQCAGGNAADKNISA